MEGNLRQIFPNIEENCVERKTHFFPLFAFQKLLFGACFIGKREGIVRALFDILIVIVERVDEVNPFPHRVKEVVGVCRRLVAKRVIGELRQDICGGA